MPRSDQYPKKPTPVVETIVSKPPLSLVTNTDKCHDDLEAVVIASPEASAFADQLREVARLVGTIGARIVGRHLIDVAAARIEREGYRYDMKCAELRDAYRTIEALEHEIRDLKTPLAIDVASVIKSAGKTTLWARLVNWLR